MGALDQLIATQYQRNTVSPMEQISGMQQLDRGRLQNQAMQTGLDADKSQRALKFAANVASQINQAENPAQKNEIYTTALQIAKMNGHDVSQFPQQYDQQAQNILDVMHMQVYNPEALAGRMKSAGFQFGGQVEVKDSKGNLFFATTKRNPQTGMVETALAPVGEGYTKPVGGLQMVSGSGLTAPEKVQQEVQMAGGKEKAKLEAQTDAATDKRFKEKLGEEGAKVYSNLQQAAQQASAFIPRLESLRDLASKVDTGTGSEIALAAKKALGIDSADMEELNAKLGELAQDILNQQTGTKTDFDFQNAVRQSAALGKTKEANKRLINALIERQNQAVKFGDMAKEAYDKNGVKGVLDMRYSGSNEDDQAREWARNNPDDPRAQEILRLLGR